MKLGALLLFSALLLPAQATTFEIRGTVSEPGLGGIAGAEVRALIPRPLTTPATPPQYLTGFTDGRGNFVLRTSTPGRYFLEATRDGYAPAPLSDPQIFLSSLAVVLDAEHPMGSSQITLARTAEVIGRVLDAETREPIEGVDVFIVQKRPGTADWSGASILSAAPLDHPPDFKTQSDGSFSIKNLRPGEYAAMAVPLQASPWVAGYTADDLKPTDQFPEMLLWPGGLPKDLAKPIPVGSGALVSFGDILLKKVPHYRAHVSLEQGNCPTGESMRVLLFPSPESTAPPQVFPCGSELLLRHLRPGTYHLYAVSDWQGERENVESAAWARAQFDIVDKNVEVPLTPQRGVIFEGQVVAADGLKDLPESIQVAVQPLEIVSGFRPQREQFVETLPDRKFRMATAPWPQDVFAGARGVFVQQIRYNGSILPSRVLPVNPGAATQRIEIVLDDKFGAIKGAVTDGSNPAPRSLVFLWEEGLRVPIMIDAADGTFQSNNLEPGEYRVVAGTRIEVGSILSELAIPERLKTGEKVTIRAGETTTLNVRAAATSK